MSSWSASDDKEIDGVRIWEGSFGQHRFRARWDQEAGHTEIEIRLLGPFIEDHDPDGMGVPFSSDLGFEWENGPRIYIGGEYRERLNNLRKRARQVSRWASKRALRYALHTIRNVPGKYWRFMEHEISTLTEEEKTELGEVLEKIIGEWNRRPTKSQAPGKEQPARVQRVPIEYDETHDIFNNDFSDSSKDTAFSAPHAQSDRDVQRRTILERLRVGAISLEEAERLLINLG
jgi:hypothetical protein